MYICEHISVYIMLYFIRSSQISLFLALWSNYFKSDFRLSSPQQNGAFDEVGFANVVAVDVRDDVAAYHALVLVNLAAGHLIGLESK